MNVISKKEPEIELSISLELEDKRHDLWNEACTNHVFLKRSRLGPC